MGTRAAISWSVARVGQRLRIRSVATTATTPAKAMEDQGPEAPQLPVVQNPSVTPWSPAKMIAAVMMPFTLGESRSTQEGFSGRVENPGQRFASATRVSARTCAPAATSLGRAASSSLWLMPRSHGTKIIPLGQRSESAIASWPAPDTMRIHE